jgi:hypothetical protein
LNKSLPPWHTRPSSFSFRFTPGSLWDEIQIVFEEWFIWQFLWHRKDLETANRAVSGRKSFRTFHDFPKQQIIMAGPYPKGPKELTNVRNMVFSLDSVMRDSSCAGHNFTWTVKGVEGEPWGSPFLIVHSTSSKWAI